MIDWTRVQRLREDVGADGFDEVIEIFLEEIDATVAELAITPPEQCEFKLHFLKNGALNLGLDQVSALCLQGEAAAACGAASTVDLGEIAAAYHSARAELLAKLPTAFAA